jgi:hypothetical protein
MPATLCSATYHWSSSPHMCFGVGTLVLPLEDLRWPDGLVPNQRFYHVVI